MAKQETIEVRLPAVLVKKATKVLANRGTTLDDFIRLQLKSAIRHNKYYELDDKFTFGKYKDEKLRTVIQTDPLYVAWCCREIAGFALSPDALELLSQMEVDL